MDAPKLKNISIVDQIKERVGSTNFFNVTELAEKSSELSLEEMIASQEASIKSNQDAAKEAERLLEKETNEEKIEILIKTIIFHNETVKDAQTYLNSIKPKNG
jgi:hypothetical protein